MKDRGIIPGLVLIIMGGLVLLAYYGYLAAEWWQYFIVGLGIMFIILSWIRQLEKDPGRSRLSLVLTGLALVVAGFLALFNPARWWPAILIAAGLGIVLVRIFSRRIPHKSRTE
jgi:hypothetical protein